MIIHPSELIETDEHLKIQSLIEYSEHKKYLWYTIPRKYKQFVTTEKLDGFLVGLLPLAMRLGEDIEVKGAVSEKLYFNLTQSYMKLLTIVIPGLRTVKIKIQEANDGTNISCKGAVVTGFSAGVDSFCVIHDHYLNAFSEPHKVTHFVFNNVGSHGEWDSKKAKELFNQRYDAIKGYPQELGVDFIKIDSNLSDLLQWDFQQSHIPRNASAILLLQKLFSKYYYASAYKYEDCVAKSAKELALVDPISIHLLSTETLECISSGCEYSRVEKTKKMANVPQANNWLNVCVNSKDGTNCSICYKCCRTLLTLEVLGLLDRFNSVFDLEKWKKIRKSYIRNNLADKKNPFIREIIEYSKKTGYAFEPVNVVAAKFYKYKFLISDFPLFKLFEKNFLMFDEQ